MCHIVFISSFIFFGDVEEDAFHMFEFWIIGRKKEERVSMNWTWILNVFFSFLSFRRGSFFFCTFLVSHHITSNSHWNLISQTETRKKKYKEENWTKTPGVQIKMAIQNKHKDANKQVSKTRISDMRKHFYSRTRQNGNVYMWVFGFEFLCEVEMSNGLILVAYFGPKSLYWDRI